MRMLYKVTKKVRIIDVRKILTDSCMTSVYVISVYIISVYESTANEIKFIYITPSFAHLAERLDIQLYQKWRNRRIQI